MNKSSYCLILLMCFVLLCGVQESLAANYTVENIGPLGSDQIYAHAINENGQVAVRTNQSENYMWENNVFTALPTSFSSMRAANDINDSKFIVGKVQDASNYDRAVVWEYNGGTYTEYALPDIGTGPEQASAKAINNSGVIAGWARDNQSFETHAVVWKKVAGNYQLTDLGTLGTGTLSQANDINGSGHIVGNSRIVDGQFNQHAFLWNGTAMTDLGTLDSSSNSFASAINNNGQVVGVSNNKIFLWENSPMQDLGKPTGSQSVSVTDFNDLGQIILSASFQEPDPYDPWGPPIFVNKNYLYENGGFTEIEDLFPANSGWSNVSVNGLNNLGQIVGAGQYNDGQTTKFFGFVLTPEAAVVAVPEPASLILLALGVAGLIRRKTA